MDIELDRSKLGPYAEDRQEYKDMLAKRMEKSPLFKKVIEMCEERTKESERIFNDGLVKSRIIKVKE